VDDYCHREPVTRVKWFKDLKTSQATRRANFLLASVSGDGKLLVWNIGNMSFPLYGSLLQSSRIYHGSILPFPHLSNGKVS